MKTKNQKTTWAHFVSFSSQGRMRILAGVAALGVVGLPLQAAVKLPAIFGDHMVMQRDAVAPIWGTADANEAITVTVGATACKVRAGEDGKWLAQLKGLQKSEMPVEVTVAGASNTITCKDVLIGDVWVCAGQSNMGLPLCWTTDGKAAIPSAKHPTIRLFSVAKKTALKPLDDCQGVWQVCTPETVKNFSAVGFFFARQILETQKVPLGLISDNVGGTPAQTWTRLEAMSSDPALKNGYVNLDKLLGNLDAVCAEHEKWMKEYGSAYQASMDKWNADNRTATLNHTPVPPRPAPPATPEPLDPLGGNSFPGIFYNGMIHPIMPFGIKGVIWYQGEYNCSQHALYRKLFPLMIQDWRKHWGQGDFPFLFVQLPNVNNRKPDLRAGEDCSWCYARETQMLGLKAISNSAMAVTIDLGDAIDIHPRYKAGVGYRLALAARHLAYGENLVYSSPLYESHQTEGNKITVRFSQVGAGLKIAKSPFSTSNPDASTNELKGFAVCGADHKLVRAKARIVGADSVIVWSDDVAEPKQVYYGWEMNPEVNLYNSADLPASPFRTDTSLEGVQ